MAEQTFCTYFGKKKSGPLKDGEDIEYITTPELIEEKFGKEVELIIDGGIGGIEPSTIVNCTNGEAEIVRQGKGILNDF